MNSATAVALRGDQLLGGSLWDSPATLDLTVVVPYYNPGTRVRSTVDELVATLGRTDATFEVIAVSDGSTDGSEASLRGLPTGLVRTARLGQNQGKGEALRTGFMMARGRFIGFIDADGDLPPEQIAVLAAFAAAPAGTEYDEGNGPPDVVVGTKRHPESQVVYPPVRRVYSWVWQQLVFLLFHLRLRDTQTGFKLFRRAVLAEVLPWTIEKRFAFDLELLVLAHRAGYRRVVEVPVRIRERAGSTVSTKAALGMFMDLLSIFFRIQVPPFDGLPPATKSPLLPAPVVIGRDSSPDRPRSPVEVGAGRRSTTRTRLAVVRSEVRFAGTGPFDPVELVLAGRERRW